MQGWWADHCCQTAWIRQAIASSANQLLGFAITLLTLLVPGQDCHKHIELRFVRGTLCNIALSSQMAGNKIQEPTS
jgi:hypothetical protein